MPDRPTLSDCLETPGIILDRHPSGDRIYHDCSPTLRSLSSTNGHSCGNGAFKVKADDGSTRPLTANEYEKLMGWSRGSTATGITADGKEIAISKTQRQKMLGNGVIPAEITHICQAITPYILKLQPRRKS